MNADEILKTWPVAIQKVYWPCHYASIICMLVALIAWGSDANTVAAWVGILAVCLIARASGMQTAVRVLVKQEEGITISCCGQ